MSDAVTGTPGPPAHPDPELLSAYVDGNAEPADAAVVREHVLGCTVCRDHVEDLRLVRDVMQGLPFVDPPFGFYERTLRLGPRPRSRAGARVVLSVVLGVVALAAVLVVVVVAPRQPDAIDPQIISAANELGIMASAPPTAAPQVVPGGLPATLAGYRYVGEQDHGGSRYLVYDDGSTKLAVTWDDAELDPAVFPDGTRAQAVPVGAEGDEGWYVAGGSASLLLVQRGDRVYTVVAVPTADAAAIAAELPAVTDDPSAAERVQAAGRSLLEAFGLGG